jgi:hypothetical protein
MPALNEDSTVGNVDGVRSGVPKKRGGLSVAYRRGLDGGHVMKHSTLTVLGQYACYYTYLFGRSNSVCPADAVPPLVIKKSKRLDSNSFNELSTISMIRQG